MKNVVMLLMVTLSACSSAQVKVERTKHTDPVLRVAIDPNTPSDTAAKLRVAAMKSGFFQVVDRGVGFEAAKAEQDLVHRDLAHRFDKKEKYARLSKLLGVGGILVPEGKCQLQQNYGYYYMCSITLTLVNATTGEIIAASEDTQEVPVFGAANWGHAVMDVIEQYPAEMLTKNDPNQYLEEAPALVAYKKQIQAENE